MKRPWFLSFILALGCSESDNGDAIEIPAGDSSQGDGSTGDTAEPDPTVTSAPETTAVEACTACGGDCNGAVLTYPTAKHIPAAVPLVYSEPPPAGGHHDGCWARWGVHDEVLPARNFVHNLEHGGVVFLYDCPGGCEGDVQELETFVETLPDWAIVTRFPGLPRRFAALSWGHRLLTNCIDEVALQAFYDTNKGHGPETVKAGPPSTCPQ